MKFILHNLRMIWARLSNSGWVLAELFLVFIVMCMGHRTKRILRIERKEYQTY